MANTVRLESGWLLRQLESAEQRASNLPFWLTQSRPSAPNRSSSATTDTPEQVTPSREESRE